MRWNPFSKSRKSGGEREVGRGGNADTIEVDRKTGESPAVDPEVLRRGVRAYRQGRYDEALPLLLTCGERGSLEAQRFLSRIYYAGHGTPADPERYLYWLARAAENGDPAARAKLKRRLAVGDVPESLLDDPFIRTLARRGPQPPGTSHRT